jgi:hypothetical protein
VSERKTFVGSKTPQYSPKTTPHKIPNSKPMPIHVPLRPRFFFGLAAEAALPARELASVGGEDIRKQAP